MQDRAFLRKGRRVRKLAITGTARLLERKLAAQEKMLDSMCSRLTREQAARVKRSFRTVARLCPESNVFQQLTLAMRPIPLTKRKPPLPKDYVGVYYVSVAKKYGEQGTNANYDVFVDNADGGSDKYVEVIVDEKGTIIERKAK